MKRLVVLLVAGASLALVAAGCGGGGGEGSRLSKDEYQQKFQDLGEELRSSFGDFSNVNPTDIAGISDLFTRLGDALDAAGDRIGELRPPEEVQDAQDKLVSAVHELADDVRDLADRVKNATLSELTELQSELDITKSDAYKKIQEAIEEFRSKGYGVGDLGG